MVIVHISGGLGNQLFQYAAARQLAHKLNTELKLDVTGLKVTDELLPHGSNQYKLCYFNIQENFATPEEIARVKEQGVIPPPVPDLENFHGDIFVKGHWMSTDPTSYEDIITILYQEFSLKNPPGASAQKWREKILAAECSVSLHVRHGDYLYIQPSKENDWTTILPLDYYCTCIYVLKQQYKNLTVFVFSDDIKWCKENLRLDVPTEFVSGGGTTDFEELYLMSLCKHNITANSTFSWWGAWLNQNPDKKCFEPNSSNAEEVQKYLHSLDTKEISPLDNMWVEVPFNLDNQPEIKPHPHFSLLLVVNNDRDIVKETLDSILAQDYKYYDVIIIDNASFDGSRKICQQAVKTSDKVTLIKLCDKVSDGAAWNMALSVAQGNSVMFLKGGDRIFPDALKTLYINKNTVEDIIYSYVWFREDEHGTFSAEGKNFSFETDTILQDLTKSSDKTAVISEILSDNKIRAPLETKIFKRKFLLDKNLRFDETIAAEDAERNFTVKAMLSTDNEIFFCNNPFYIAPRK